MTKIDNKRKLNEKTLKKLQDLLYENKELLNTNDFKKLYDIANKSLMTTTEYGDFIYLLMVSGIDPLKYMDEIPSYYLSYSEDLISIDIPGNITSIEQGAFCNCKMLTSVTIGKCVTSIGNDAFSGCSKLTSITIPNSVTSIGRAAFAECSSLTSVTIPDSVTYINKYVFSNCKSLKYINYYGTKAQWHDLLNGEHLKGISTDCIIHCKDGDINV